MNPKNIGAIALRIIRQFKRDKRTVGLVIIAPMVALTLMNYVFNGGSAFKYKLAVVNMDLGYSVMMMETVQLGDKVEKELLSETSAYKVVETIKKEEFTTLTEEEVNNRLNSAIKKGDIYGAVVLKRTFTMDMFEGGTISIDFKINGSDPQANMLLIATVTKNSMKALSRYMKEKNVGASSGMSEEPLKINREFIFGGEQFTFVDYLAPVYISIIVLFFVFLLTIIAFIRERGQGTIDRLIISPLSRVEVMTGYVLGFLIFALIQSTIIILFVVYVLRIHYLGPLWMIFAIEFWLIICSVCMGIFLSSFAKNEFQAIQFIPMFIIPQIFICGTFWPIETFPGWLKVIAYCLPLTYSNAALRDVMLKGYTITQIYPNILVLIGFTVGLIILGSFAIKKQSS